MMHGGARRRESSQTRHAGRHPSVRPAHPSDLARTRTNARRHQIEQNGRRRFSSAPTAAQGPSRRNPATIAASAASAATVGPAAPPHQYRAGGSAGFRAQGVVRLGRLRQIEGRALAVGDDGRRPWGRQRRLCLGGDTVAAAIWRRPGAISEMRRKHGRFPRRRRRREDRGGLGAASLDASVRRGARPRSGFHHRAGGRRGRGGRRDGGADVFGAAVAHATSASGRG